MRRLITYLQESEWLITPERWQTLIQALEAIREGAVSPSVLKTEPVEARIAWALDDEAREMAGLPFVDGMAVSPAPGDARNVAVLPISGTIYPKLGGAAPASGGTNLRAFMGLMQRAVADPNVSSIVMVFDSPGGMVSGIPEAAAQIRAWRGSKPISAIADFEMNSAAFYLGAQADEIVASPSSNLGSIGVVAQYESAGKALDMQGIQVQTLRFPANKAEADGIAPLSEEAVAYRLGQMKATYDMFVENVALGRRVPPSRVRSADWGQGRTLKASDAVNVGMADRIATFDQLLTDHLTGNIMKKKGWQSSKTGAIDLVLDVVPPTIIEEPPPAAPVEEPPATLRTRDDFKARWPEIA